MSGWIGFDFDGTMATHEHGSDPSTIGRPVPRIIERVKAELAAGKEVRIFTARVDALGKVKPNDIVPMHYSARAQECAASVALIREFCALHIGQVLTITCIKDRGCERIYDDKAVQVIKNTGQIVGQG